MRSRTASGSGIRCIAAKNSEGTVRTMIMLQRLSTILPVIAPRNTISSTNGPSRQPVNRISTEPDANGSLSATASSSPSALVSGLSMSIMHRAANAARTHDLPMPAVRIVSIWRTMRSLMNTRKGTANANDKPASSTHGASKSTSESMPAAHAYSARHEKNSNAVPTCSAANRAKYSSDFFHNVLQM